MDTPPAARAERIIGLPNVREVSVQGLAVPRTELGEGGTKGAGEGAFFGIDGGRGSGAKESMGGEVADRQLDCFGVERANDTVV